VRRRRRGGVSRRHRGARRHQAAARVVRRVEAVDVGRAQAPRSSCESARVPRPDRGAGGVPDRICVCRNETRSDYRVVGRQMADGGRQVGRRTADGETPMPALPVCVVGAGPCGLAAAVALEKAGIPAIVFDRSCVARAIARYPTYLTFFSSPERLEIGDVPFVTAGEKPTRREGLADYRPGGGWGELTGRPDAD